MPSLRVFVCLSLWATSYVVCAPAFGVDAPMGSVTKVLDNGSDGLRINIAVLADGYDASAADQNKFNNDVASLLLSGVFGHDFYQAHQSAFNIYRVNLISAESGVSQRKYDEEGTPFDPSDDEVVSDLPRNSALKFIWSGSWAHCWLEFSADTESLLDAALAKYVPTYNYLLVILNQDSYGGCGGGGRQYVPRGVSWDVIAHEYGHGIGGLLDEYFNPGTTYSGPAVNGPNVSTVLDRFTVAWHDLILPGTPVPTTPGPGIDSNRTVGEFLGGGTFASGMYRPVDNCRMRSNTPPYCPVCERQLMGIIGPHLPPSPAPHFLPTSKLSHMTVPLELRTGLESSTDHGRIMDQHANQKQPSAAPKEVAQPGDGAAQPNAQSLSYLHLVLRVDQSGQAKVVSAVQVPGPTVMTDAKVGNYAYEVTQKDNQPVVLHSIPDPFEGRAFSSPATAKDPAGKPEGHHAIDRKTADVVVRLPNTTLEQAIQNEYALKFYKISPGPQHFHTLNKAAMASLREAGRLSVATEVPATQLGPQLKALGRKLDAR